jgi:hypothetical protein
MTVFPELHWESQVTQPVIQPKPESCHSSVENSKAEQILEPRDYVRRMDTDEGIRTLYPQPRD